MTQDEGSHPSLVSVCPPEILAAIFQRCSDQAHLTQSDDTLGYRCPYHFCTRSCLSWIVVTHVCRQWRFTALSYATLWNQIPSFSPEWKKVFLDRAGTSPVQVNAVLNNIEDICQYIENSGVARAKDLVIGGWEDKVSPFLSQPLYLPLLQSVAISTAPTARFSRDFSSTLFYGDIHSRRSASAKSPTHPWLRTAMAITIVPSSSAHNPSYLSPSVLQKCKPG